MKRFLLATTALAMFAGAPAFADDTCRDRLDALEQGIGAEDTYATVLRSGMQDEIGTLWDVAADLDRQGNEEACLQIANALESMVTKAQTPGIVDADAWEEEQRARLEAATPVAESQGRMRIQDIIGMDVYTPRNEYLGELDDVVLTDQGIGYGVIERGGFFGVGGDEVPVPWNRFMVTQDGDTLVLDIDPATLEAAPTYQAFLPDEEIDADNDGNVDNVDQDEPMVDFDAIRENVDDFFNNLTD